MVGMDVSFVDAVEYVENVVSVQHSDVEDH